MAFRKQRMGRKKVCYFTKNKIEYIDYKDVELLKRKDRSSSCNRHTCKISAYAGDCNQTRSSDGIIALRQRISITSSVRRRFSSFY